MPVMTQLSGVNNLCICGASGACGANDTQKIPLGFPEEGRKTRFFTASGHSGFITTFNTEVSGQENGCQDNYELCLKKLFYFEIPLA
jgi:hypothetical protein